MKKNIYLLLGFMGSFCLALGQTNIYPPAGDVGIGTTSPRSALDVARFIPNGALGTVFGRLTEGDDEGNGTFLGVRGFVTNVLNSRSFSIIHNFYGQTNSSINFLRGNSITGGSITFSTNSDIERVRIDVAGNVGIGTSTPAEKLSVNGKIRAHEIKVELANWPDFVFAKDYALPTLQETEKHIKEKGHLPGIPTAAEVEKNGIELGDMNKKLLQKIEELTLYLIEMKKELKAQQNEINILKTNKIN